MSSDFLNERKNALENQFFARQEQEALEKLRQKNAGKARHQALKDASGISDDGVIAALDTAGIGPETLAALSLVPLVAVAWADGKLDDGEREAIERAASEAQIAGPAQTMLQSWLAEAPEAGLLETWKAYIGALKDSLTVEAHAELRQHLVGGARVVAEAAGGFMGFGNKISNSEALVLDELDACFVGVVTCCYIINLICSN